jgi:hypothetical protein
MPKLWQIFILFHISNVADMSEEVTLRVYMNFFLPFSKYWDIATTDSYLIAGTECRF